MRGQEHARRALEVAAAGGHNLLLTGVPGAGKTLLARCLPSILPPPTLDEALEVTRVYSVCGLLQPEQPLIRPAPLPRPPPHHQPRRAGGRWVAPAPGGARAWPTGGCCSWTSCPSSTCTPWRRCASRWRRGASPSPAPGRAPPSPARVTLVAAMNPCPCGYAGRFAAPLQLLGRRAAALPPAPLRAPPRPHRHAPGSVPRPLRQADGGRGRRRGRSAPPPEPSAPVRARVVAARERQQQRFAGSAHLLQRRAWAPARCAASPAPTAPGSS